MCRNLLSSAASLFGCLGVPVALEKTKGPIHCLSYLAIEVDTVACCCRLPAEKVRKLLEQVEDCLGRGRVRLQKVQSLLGSFNFACWVITMGWVFCRKLERSTAGVTNPHHTCPVRSKVILRFGFLF